MYDTLKMKIKTGNFSVPDTQRNIKKIYAMGDLTEEQFDDLFSLLAEKANPELERPETLALIQNLSAKVEALTARVKALEDGDATIAGEEDTAEYPAWKPWDGLSSQYQPGAIVSHNGQLWQSVYNGQNVWEPGVVDRRFWIPYTPEE